MKKHVDYLYSIGQDILGAEDNNEAEIPMNSFPILGETYFAIEATVGVPA